MIRAEESQSFNDDCVITLDPPPLLSQSNTRKSARVRVASSRFNDVCDVPVLSPAKPKKQSGVTERDTSPSSSVLSLPLHATASLTASSSSSSVCEANEEELDKRRRKRKNELAIERKEKKQQAAAAAIATEVKQGEQEERASKRSKNSTVDFTSILRSYFPRHWRDEGEDEEDDCMRFCHGLTLMSRLQIMYGELPSTHMLSALVAYAQREDICYGFSVSVYNSLNSLSSVILSARAECEQAEEGEFLLHDFIRTHWEIVCNDFLRKWQTATGSSPFLFSVSRLYVHSHSPSIADSKVSSPLSSSAPSLSRIDSSSTSLFTPKFSCGVEFARKRVLFFKLFTRLLMIEVRTSRSSCRCPSPDCLCPFSHFQGIRPSPQSLTPPAQLSEHFSCVHLSLSETYDSECEACMIRSLHVEIHACADILSGLVQTSGRTMKNLLASPSKPTPNKTTPTEDQRFLKPDLPSKRKTNPVLPVETPSKPLKSASKSTEGKKERHPCLFCRKLYSPKNIDKHVMSCGLLS